MPVADSRTLVADTVVAAVDSSIRHQLTYRVKNGDTLTSIARVFLDDRRLPANVGSSVVGNADPRRRALHDLHRAGQLGRTGRVRRVGRTSRACEPGIHVSARLSRVPSLSLDQHPGSPLTRVLHDEEPMPCSGRPPCLGLSEPGPGRSRRLVRLAILHDGRAARRQRSRSPPSGSGARFELRLRVPCPLHLVNLAPADVRKAGAAFDLPIALGVRPLKGLSSDDTWATSWFGELSLDGSIHGGAVCSLSPPRRVGTASRACCFPARTPARPPSSATVFAVTTLAEAVAALNHPIDGPAGSGRTPRPPSPPSRISPTSTVSSSRGGRSKLRALGGHNLLLVGPPGAGDDDGAARTGHPAPARLRRSPRSDGRPVGRGAVRRGGGLIVDWLFVRHITPCLRSARWRRRTAAPGRGEPGPTMGALSDEMLESPRVRLLRQPLEEGHVTIARAARSATFPARFVLVCAMNPCPCGFAGDATRVCRCTPLAGARYRHRLSGPLRDRLDLMVEVPAIPPDVLGVGVPGESSAAFVPAWWRRGYQRRRTGTAGTGTNAALSPSALAVAGWTPMAPVSSAARSRPRGSHGPGIRSKLCARSRAPSRTSRVARMCRPITSPRPSNFGWSSSTSSILFDVRLPAFLYLGRGRAVWYRFEVFRPGGPRRSPFDFVD